MALFTTLSLSRYELFCGLPHTMCLHARVEGIHVIMRTDRALRAALTDALDRIEAGLVTRNRWFGQQAHEDDATSSLLDTAAVAATCSDATCVIALDGARVSWEWRDTVWLRLVAGDGGVSLRTSAPMRHALRELLAALDRHEAEATVAA